MMPSKIHKENNIDVGWAIGAAFLSDNGINGQALKIYIRSDPFGMNVILLLRLLLLLFIINRIRCVVEHKMSHVSGVFGQQDIRLRTKHTHILTQYTYMCNILHLYCMRIYSGIWVSSLWWSFSICMCVSSDALTTLHMNMNI